MRRIFLAGIIQGSNLDKGIHPQDYREKIKSIIKSVYPRTVVYDPFDGHENSIDYGDEEGKDTFFGALDRINGCDLMIAYLPHASLGTAIEIWESYKRGIPVWTITNMKSNWVVRFCSERIFDDIESFAEYMQGIHAATMKGN